MKTALVVDTATFPTVRRWLRTADIDRAVFFGLAGMGWQFATGPLTLLVLVAALSGEAQGYYYTFASLIALQGFLELGLSTVVIATAGHESANLNIDAAGCLTGTPTSLSRLVSLGRFAGSWYAAAGCAFVLLIGPFGHWFLANQADVGISWRSPWWILVVLTGVQIAGVPVTALLEGCREVTNIQRIRLIHMIVRTLALWSALLSGVGLWAVVIAAGFAVLRDIYLVAYRYRDFFRRFRSRPTGPVIDWKREILPMQWRLGLSGLVGYFFFHTFTVVMFQFHGPIVAGQMGMTLSIVAIIQGIAAPWVQPKLPVFSLLIARKDYRTLDNMFRRTLGAVVAASAILATVTWLSVAGINAIGLSVSNRFLAPFPTALLSIGAVAMSAAFGTTAYLRAHRREPLLALSVVTALLMAALVWQWGARFGPLGAASAYLVVTAGVVLPWQMAIVSRARRVWHAA